MPDLDRNPYAGIEFDAPPLALGGRATQAVCSFVGLSPVLEDVVRNAGHTFVQNTTAGRHLVCVEDVYGLLGAVPQAGRYMELYTVGDSANPNLTPGTFSGQRRLAGIGLGDVPDFATMSGYTGMMDGHGRTLPAGEGQVVTQIAQVRNNKSAIQTTVVSEHASGPTFITRSGTQFGSTGGHNPFNNPPAQNDAEYFGYANPFGILQLFFTFGSNTFSGAIVFEYWDGSAWTALSNVTDGTSNFSVFGAGNVEVSFDVPLDWATTTVNSVGPFYFIRARISSASPSGIVPPIGSYTRVNKILQQASHSGLATAPPAGYATYWDRSVDLRPNDVAYFGLDAPWEKLRLTANADAASSVAFAFEYWDGSAWTALSGVSDATSNFTVATKPQDITWTVPGDWATRSVVGLGPLYWIRLRVTTITTTFGLNQIGSSTRIGVKQTTPTVPSGTPGQAPVCMDPGRPGTDDERTPEVIGWGIALPSGINADPNGIYTYYDPIRRIRSRRFDIAANGGYVPLHGEPNVTKVARWSGTGVGATVLGTSDTGIVYDDDPSNADANAVAGKDGGPPIFYDEAAVNRDYTKQPYTCCVLRNRVYFAYENQIGWTDRGEFHNHPIANRLDVAPNDGDRIVGIYSFADKVIIFKGHHVYALVGEPSVGTTGLQIVEYSNVVGCVAKRSIVDVGAQLLFLSQNGVQQMDTNGVVQPIEVSEPIRGIINTAIQRHGQFLWRADATWHPDKSLYLLAMPGIVEQLSGAEGLQTQVGQGTNDGLLVYCRRNGQWAIWPGPDNFYQSLATSWVDTQTREVIGGHQNGLIMHLVEQPAFSNSSSYLGDFRSNLGGQGVGFVESATAGEITATGAFLDDTTDTRMLGWYIYMLTGPAAGRFLPIVTTTVNTLGANFGDAPKAGDVFLIGNIFWYFDTGDLVWGDPTQDRQLRDARVYFNGNPGDQPIVLAVDNSPVAEHGDLSADDNRTTRGFRYANRAVRVPTNGARPPLIALPGSRGLTARLRIAGRIGYGAAFRERDGKPRIRQVILGGRTFGRAGDA